MSVAEVIIRICGHCGNRAPHRLKLEYIGKLLYDDFGGDPAYEPYQYAAFACDTCEGLSLFGAHRLDQVSDKLPAALYPRGPLLDPPAHTVPGLRSPIPATVRRAFVDAWPLRHTAPNAFANQIRRALEFVCADQQAKGTTLHGQLADLAGRGVFPPGLAATASLLKTVGNVASHATDREIDPWDAELIEEFFRSIVEYVYLVPARIARLNQRMGT